MRIARLSRWPRGTTLIELVVALPLLALLGVISIRLALAAHRHALRTDGTLAASRELRQAANVLSAELRVIRSSDVRAWNDTLVEFDGLVGSGFVCALTASPVRVALAAGDQSRAESVSWIQSPQGGDDLSLWVVDSVGRAPRPIARSLRAVTSGASCSGSPLTAGANTSSNLEVTTPVNALMVGAPVRITRRTRFSLYKASDGDWFLGRRTLGPTGWDVIQPVAGPLMDARRFGLRIVALDIGHRRIAAGDVGTRAAGFAIELRAPARVGRANVSSPATDSMRFEISFRSDSAGIT